MTSQEWYGLCIVTLVVLASGDLGARAEGNNGGPPPKRKRMTDKEEHFLEAYDCNEPDEVTAHPIKTQDGWRTSLEDGEVQNYTIVRKTATFDYEATFCIVHRTREYYQCIKSSYLGVMAPSETYRKDTHLTAKECAIMGSTGVFEDGITGRRIRLDKNSRTNHFTDTLIGEIYYSNGSCRAQIERP